MNTTRFGFFVLMTLLTLSVGCQSPGSNPLQDWQRYPSQNPAQAGAVIAADYESYIYHLPPDQKSRVRTGSVSFYWHANGRKAVKISIPTANGNWRQHLLIYNLDFRRIKTIKFETGQP